MKPVIFTAINTINQLAGSNQTGQLDTRKIIQCVESRTRDKKTLDLIKQLLEEYKNA